MRKIILLLLAISFSFSACVGEVSMSLPAIREGTGLLVRVSMKGVPGPGVEYVGTEPTIGAGTQKSLSIAADVARKMTGGGERCDLLVRVDDSDSPGGVDGPSAGAAFAMMAYSLFSGEKMRSDATITGGITAEGMLQSVGGLYEKAVSSKMAGIKHFVTPPQSVEEKLMLKSISGIEIHEAADADEVVGFFFRREELPEKPLELKLEPLGNLTPYSGERVPEMGRIVDALIRSEKREIARIGDARVREYFKGRAAQHEEIYGLGYDYAAANGAFLTKIIAAAIAEVDEPDFGRKKKEVEQCLDSLSSPKITVSNYEWVMGGEARQMRANKNYRKYAELEPETKDEKYLLVYQLGYSKAWCEAAAAMYSIEANGKEVSSLQLKEIAKSLLNYTEDYGEWEEYAQTGRELYEEGKYAGAVYELAFVKGMVEGDLIAKKGGDCISELAPGNGTSMWGKVFRGHAKYMEETGSMEDVCRMAAFSKEMDRIASEIAGKEDENNVQTRSENSLCLPAFVAFGMCCAVGCRKMLKN